MSDDKGDSNGTPPPSEHPAKFVTMTDIERIIDRLELPRNVVKNTEGALTDLLPRLERLEDQFKTFSIVWADSITTRKEQLDRIEKDLDDYSDKIEALTKLVETQINLQEENDERIRLMIRDVYGYGTGDETRVIGLIGRQQRAEVMLTEVATKIAFREKLIALIMPLLKSTAFRAALAAALGTIGGGGLLALLSKLFGG